MIINYDVIPKIGQDETLIVYVESDNIPTSRLKKFMEDLQSHFKDATHKTIVTTMINSVKTIKFSKESEIT